MATRRRLKTGGAPFVEKYLAESRGILAALDPAAIEALALRLARLRRHGGRLFVLGVGGSAGHAAHAVNDFRKICGIEAYAPTDNVAELTARINDDGWDGVFAEWLRVSRLGRGDAVLVFSVGGGDVKRGVSIPLVRAVQAARRVRAEVYGVVGRDGGFTRKNADVCVFIPPLAKDRITPHTEGICAVIWHLVVSHPALQKGT